MNHGLTPDSMLGFRMPHIGLGVYQNYTTHESVVEALRAGYRRALLVLYDSESGGGVSH